MTTPKIIDRVTITGADDSIEAKALKDIEAEFPFVEWGILLSKNSEGHSRFPSLSWMENLQALNLGLVSGHLCGRWVRDICDGNWTFLADRLDIAPMFHRFQLNFHSYVHRLNRDPFIAGAKAIGRQLIFQLDDVNNGLLDVARQAGIDAVPLFDLSGGAGVLPAHWPKARDCYSGYAGGLSPSNVVEQIEKICAVASNPIWIDVETHVRSTDDHQFDLNKVRAFLTNAAPFVMERSVNLPV